MRLVDKHDNVSPEFEEATVEVRISHNASGGGLVQLDKGEASITLRSEVAARVEISAAEVKVGGGGLPAGRAIDTSRVLEVRVRVGDRDRVRVRVSAPRRHLVGGGRWHGRRRLAPGRLVSYLTLGLAALYTLGFVTLTLRFATLTLRFAALTLTITYPYP